MNKKILISYGDACYRKSLQRLGDNAKSLNIFDEVILYSEKDLPEEIRNHELMNYRRGGGYWIWKPWIVLHTLERMDESDILVFSDSGNVLYPDKEWQKWFKIMKNHNGLFFCYAATMEERCRKNLLNYYGAYPYMKRLYQIQSSIFLLGGGAKSLQTAKEWFDVMYQHPEFVMDVPENEKINESSRFIEHRHDQAVLSCVVYAREKANGLKVLWNHSEGLFREGQAVHNARISDDKRRGCYHYAPVWKWLLKSIITRPLRCLRNKLIRM